MKAAHTLKKLGARIELFPTTESGSATELARLAVSRGAPRIIVAGGDGTLNEVINGIAGTRTELAIIPTGTANVLAIEMDVPMNVTKACALAFEGKATAVDLGLAGDRYFALMAGIGFDAMVIKNINPVLKKTIRHAAFPVSGLVTFIQEDLPLLSVKTADHETEGYFVVVANSKYYGGRFGPTPDASMTDGMFDICVLKKKRLAEMLNFWIGALRKSRIDDSAAEYFRAPVVEVNCPTGSQVLVQTDGEIVGELPMSMTIVPRALNICAGEKG